MVEVGDLVVYFFHYEDHLCEVIGKDKTSGLIQIQFQAGDFKGDKVWVRPNVVEVIDFSNKSVNNDACECGLGDQKVPGRAHFRWCKRFKND